jgi:FkbM family methyltransferase
MGSIKSALRKTLRGIYYSVYGQSGKTITINNEPHTVSAYIARGVNPVIDETPLKLLINLAKDADILFDIGANVGIISVIVANKMKPGSTIYSFEPVPNTFKFLNDSARVQKGNAKVKAFNYAISSKNETLQFSNMERTTRNHIIKEAATNTIPVTAVSLDSFCAEHKVIPQVLKIDIEGAEYWALQGMQQTLKNNNCKVLVEIHQEYLQANGITGKMFEDYVNSIGYKVFNIEGKEISPDKMIANVNVILAKEHPGQAVFTI